LIVHLIRILVSLKRRTQAESQPVKKLISHVVNQVSLPKNALNAPPTPQVTAPFSSLPAPTQAIGVKSSRNISSTAKGGRVPKGNYKTQAMRAIEDNMNMLGIRDLHRSVCNYLRSIKKEITETSEELELWLKWLHKNCVEYTAFWDFVRLWGASSINGNLSISRSITTIGSLVGLVSVDAGQSPDKEGEEEILEAYLGTNGTKCPFRKMTGKFYIGSQYLAPLFFPHGSTPNP
jgi:hypothetical protein